MNPGPIRETPVTKTGAPHTIGYHTEPNRNNRDREPTQYDRVLAMLLKDEEVCGSVFYRAFIPRFSIHIHRLRKDGYWISKRLCDLAEHHHEGTQWLYRLEALPYDPTEGG